MTDQLVLFSEPRARRRDAETSHEAAASVPASVVEERILTRFATRGPITDDELAASLWMFHPPTTKTARSRLSKLGLLVATSEKRPSARGRNMQVWRLAS